MLHIANFLDATRWTVTAGANIALGAVIRIANSGGQRIAFQVVDANSALLVPGNYGVAYKVHVDPLAVTSSTAPAAFGDRRNEIVSGDLIVQVDRGGIVEYDVSLLHTSLNPNLGGTLPIAGADMAVKNGLFAAVGTSGAIASPVVGRVFDIIGNRVRIQVV